MNLTDDDTLKFQAGIPVFIDDVCAVYPATLGEIIRIGYSKFETYLGAIITTEKPILGPKDSPEAKKLLDELTDFQYTLMLLALDSNTNQIFKEAFQFFTHEQAFFSLDPAQIIIGPLEEKHIMSESQFYDFRTLIKRMYFIEQDEQEIIISPDDDAATRAIKMKMRENREKLRRAKAKKARGSHSELQFSDLIGSVTINHCNLSMENIWNITYYAFHDQLKRMGWRDEFNINNRAALAGAKLKKEQLKHWMRSIASTDKN